MKLAKGMKLITEGWIVKPKGFRVKFQQMTAGELVTGYSPPMEDSAMDLVIKSAPPACNPLTLSRVFVRALIKITGI